MDSFTVERKDSSTKSAAGQVIPDLPNIREKKIYNQIAS